MVRRIGNFGFVESGGSIFTFNAASSASSRGWTPTHFSVRGRSKTSYAWDYITVNGVNIIPYGSDNDLPDIVVGLLENFYAGEGIMGKKAGLQWGDGPRLYRDAVDADNTPYRAWTEDAAISKEFDRSDWRTQMHRCLIDLVHLEGFWVKITRNRGGRIPGEGKIVKIEHVPAQKARFVYEGPGKAPRKVMIADFPTADPQTCHIYPLFDPHDPTRHPVSVAYYNIYSFGHDHYSVPRFIGAFDWLKLATTLAPLLLAYNENASAISKHIESPASYWAEHEQRIKDMCLQMGETYDPKMLDEFKDAAMERFAAALTGKENAGKFIHTSRFWNSDANDFEGWKITPIDNKLKEYIEAQMAICKKSEAAATSGFGLDPSLSNLILDTKLGSGSEKLYALKVYNATETAVPDMVLCRPWQAMLDCNHPGSDLRVGLYRRVVESENNINPENRVKENA